MVCHSHNFFLFCLDFLVGVLVGEGGRRVRVFWGPRGFGGLGVFVKCFEVCFVSFFFNLYLPLTSLTMFRSHQADTTLSHAPRGETDTFMILFLS